MPDFDETTKAKKAQAHAKTSAANFYEAFRVVRQARAATGAPTDGEQDLVRAALVFAAGGLDITVKELIRGSLKRLAKSDPDVVSEFDKFVHRKFRTDDSLASADPSKFLASILSSSSPYEKLIEAYIFDLTGSSLQSLDELFKAANALDIPDKFLRDKRTDLKEAFHVRNSIIHELDVKFDAGVGQRNRKSRTKTALEGHSKLMLDTAKYFIDETEKKLE